MPFESTGMTVMPSESTCVTVRGPKCRCHATAHTRKKSLRRLLLPAGISFPNQNSIYAQRTEDLYSIMKMNGMPIMAMVLPTGRGESGSWERKSPATLIDAPVKSDIGSTVCIDDLPERSLAA